MTVKPSPVKIVHEQPIVPPMAVIAYLLEVRGKASHLKLQKLLYFADAWHLAYFQTPLFREQFEAWAHGPVLRSVWDELKKLSPLYTEIKKSQISGLAPTVTFTAEQRGLLDAILRGYGKMSEDDLERIAHSDTPWLEARGDLSLGEPCRRKISKNTMKHVYSSRIVQLLHPSTGTIPPDIFRRVVDRPRQTLKELEEDSESLFCINFRHLDPNQGQKPIDWEKEGLLSKGVDLLKSLCELKMKQACSNAHRELFKTYAGFPSHSDFHEPRHTPADAKWARAKFWL